MRVLLISTYELGRQPFGLASPAASLRSAGHDVLCADLAVAPLSEDALISAGLIAFYLPMHTATRLAVPVIQRARAVNPAAHLACYGLYASLNAPYLHSLGVGALIAGEFEDALCALATGLDQGKASAPSQAFVSLDRIGFQVPDRSGLPPLDRYAPLLVGAERRTAGYTEASRGCKHRCRHCPIVPVYNGVFRIVPRDVVLADVRQQVAAGARHITFGDPDFFNGPAHAARILERLHSEFPSLTYDVTIKIEHLLRHADLLPLLRRTGCLFVTSAVESVDDAVLARLEKGHTRADFLEVVRLFRLHELALAPTFIPFTPWTTWEGYRELLRLILDLNLVPNVTPIQLALRLLIPASSRLLELPDILDALDAFQPEALFYRWHHSDPSLDALADRLLHLVDRRQKAGASRHECFRDIWTLAHQDAPSPAASPPLLSRAAIPYLTEPWYC